VSSELGNADRLSGEWVAPDRSGSRQSRTPNPVLRIRLIELFHACTDATASVRPARTLISKVVAPDTTWTTEYNSLAVTAPRRPGRDIDDAVLAHIWSTYHENIHCGTHSVDVAGERAKLGTDGYRPLRSTAAQYE
jgi:hypothetical protein